VKDLRDYITVIENAWSEDEVAIEPVVETIDEGINVADRLSDLVFKLRAHSEPLNETLAGDYGLGVEAGCEMAAEMIENLIRQLGGKE
jgi:hypothetical protein